MENALLKISDENLECLNKITGKSLLNSLPQPSNVASKSCDSKVNCRKLTSYYVIDVAVSNTDVKCNCIENIFIYSNCIKIQNINSID